MIMIYLYGVSIITIIIRKRHKCIDTRYVYQLLLYLNDYCPG